MARNTPFLGLVQNGLKRVGVGALTAVTALTSFLAPQAMAKDKSAEDMFATGRLPTKVLMSTFAKTPIFKTLLSEAELPKRDVLGVLGKVVREESGGNVNAKNPNSSARGLFGTTSGTYQKMGHKAGLSDSILKAHRHVTDMDAVNTHATIGMQTLLSGLETADRHIKTWRKKGITHARFTGTAKEDTVDASLDDPRVRLGLALVAYGSGEGGLQQVIEQRAVTDDSTQTLSLSLTKGAWSHDQNFYDRFMLAFQDNAYTGALKAARKNNVTGSNTTLDDSTLIARGAPLNPHYEETMALQKLLEKADSVEDAAKQDVAVRFFVSQEDTALPARSTLVAIVTPIEKYKKDLVNITVVGGGEPPHEPQEALAPDSVARFQQNSTDIVDPFMKKYGGRTVSLNGQEMVVDDDLCAHMRLLYGKTANAILAGAVKRTEQGKYGLTDKSLFVQTFDLKA